MGGIIFNLFAILTIVAFVGYIFITLKMSNVRHIAKQHILKNNKTGITMIALIVTIIIILLLAGVSFTILLGDNGIIAKGRKAKEDNEIAQITETLELYKAPVAVDNYNIVELDKYLEYLEKIKAEGTAQYEIIYGDRIGDQIYITVDGKYEYAIKKDENNEGNLIIEYLGKLGELKPTIISVIRDTMGDNVTLTVRARYGKDYEFLLKENEEDKDRQEKKDVGEETSCTFTGLDSNKSYIVTIIARNDNGEDTKDVTINTIPIPTITVEEPYKWSNTTKSITITKEKGYTTKYTIDGTIPSLDNGKVYNGEFTVDKNCIIFAVYIDDKNQIGSFTSNTVDKIDKEAPTASIIAGTVIEKRVTLTASGTDNEQIASYKFYINGNLFKTVTSTDESINQEYTTTFGEENVYVEVTDIAGNTKQSETITIEDLEIVNLTELKLFRDNVNKGNGYTGKTIKQIANINMNNENWIPIGSAESGKCFYGTYDGGYYKLDGLNISGTFELQGLFGRNQGTIKNVKIESGKIAPDNSKYVGGFAGYNAGTIMNCYNNAKIEGTAFYMGGIAGTSNGIIQSCSNKQEITQKNNTNNDTGIYIGGIAGYSNNLIEYCYNTAKISNELTNTIRTANNEIGGIVGRDAGTIRNSYNIGTIYESSKNIGGYSMVGGIVGYNYSNKVEQCYNVSTVYCLGNYDNVVGGIAGWNGGIISGGYVKDIESQTNEIIANANANRNFAGGIVGNNSSTGTIGNICYVDATCVAENGKSNYVGGLAGQSHSLGTILGCRYKKTNEHPTAVSGREDTIYENVSGSTTYVVPRGVIEVVGSTYYKEDTNNGNRGYPLLKWEDGTGTNVDITRPFIIMATPNTNSVKLIATDDVSGIVGYKVTETNVEPSSFISCTKTMTLETTINNLKQETTYYAWVKDGVGNVSLSKEFKTIKVTGLTITVEEPDKWSNTTKSVTITAGNSNYKTIRYTTDGTIPTTSSTEYKGAFDVSQNCTITAIAFDSTNQIGETTSNTVTKIDKEAPTINSFTQSSEILKNGVYYKTLTGSATDTLSKINAYYFHRDGDAYGSWIWISQVENVSPQIEVSQSGTYWFYAMDTTGNESKKSITVTIEMNTEDNWKIWAQKAGIDYTKYANITELLADTTAVTTLANSTAAVDYMMLSQDTKDCIRKNVLNKVLNIPDKKPFSEDISITPTADVVAQIGVWPITIMLQSSYAKNSILDNTSWRQMIIDNTELIDIIIKEKLSVKVSKSASLTSTTTDQVMRPTAKATTQEGDLIIKANASMSWANGGGYQRIIYCGIEGTGSAANASDNSYGTTTLSKAKYNTNPDATFVKVDSNAVSGGEGIKMTVSITGYVLRKDAI